MPNDKQTLEEINIKMGEAENKGGKEYHDWCDGVLAAEFAFMRANRNLEDRVAFLKRAVPLEPLAVPGDRTTEMESIEWYGKRAVVKCVVTTGGKKYHNIRLFVEQDGQWKLLGWANEEVK